MRGLCEGIEQDRGCNSASKVWRRSCAIASNEVTIDTLGGS